ncbi:MAG: hypothetical protein J0M08_03210 [Bacteroidetes bacterium]|nr:hypothetical protein [Bacteroidota bacterium]
MQKIFFIAVLFLCIISCKKKDKELALEPTIELESVEPTSVMEFRDSVIVTLSYKDNNGDLGDESADEKSVHVKDSRLLNADGYHLKPITPNNEELQTQGKIRIKLKNMFRLGNATQENATLSIKIKDRAGNWSNEIVTSSIAIHDSL